MNEILIPILAVTIIGLKLLHISSTMPPLSSIPRRVIVNGSVSPGGRKYKPPVGT